MGQERYTAEISVPTTVVVLPLQQGAANFSPTTPPHCPTRYNTMPPWLDYVPCAHPAILIESDEGQIEKALNTRMFRSRLYGPAPNVTLS